MFLVIFGCSTLLNTVRNRNGKNLIEKQAGQVELRAFTARGSAVCFVALCRA